MTKIKICGITNLSDALYAADCGADALGFNFCRASLRYIDPIDARSIVTKLDRSIEVIGVFVKDDLDTVTATASLVGLTALQLHGDEDAAYIEECRLRSGLPVIKAFRVGPSFSPSEVAQCQSDAILLDTYSEKEVGGTGKVFDWAKTRDISRFFPKVYLAGGLSADNVADAIRTVRPYAVDACSCLEIAPRFKDPYRVKNFIAAAKETL